MAGITLTYVFGDNSVFNQASDAKIKTEIGKIEERAQTIYSEKLLENASSTLSIKVETSDVIEQLKSEDYIIGKRPVAEGKITGISLDKENITMGKNKTAEITVTYEGVDDPFVYYVEVQGKYYQMHSNKGFITIDREASNLTKTDFENENEGEGNTSSLTVTSSDETVATAVLKGEGNKTIEIASKEKEAETTITVTYGSYTKECKVKVKEFVLATELELGSVRARIAKDYTRWLTAVAKPEETTIQEFEWSSSDTSIATVDNKGVVTAIKAGTTTITVKTTDGSNLSKTCEVTIVENAPDVATLTEIQTGEKNVIAKDNNGNLITVPIGFKVLTSEGTNVTQGIVIQDSEGNEFVWVPVDSVSTGTSKPADDIRLGRYDNFSTKNASGNYVPKQDADNYTQTVTINSYFQELTSNSGNTASKNLGDFVTKTKTNGGYYFGRYEASQGSNGKVDTQVDKTPWVNITQPNAATAARNMYSSDYVESDLINSYSWDTAIVFIQKYNENSNYANQTRKSTTKLNTGKAGDKVCNIHDMASNCFEWSTEHSTTTSLRGSYPCVYGGGVYSSSDCTTSYRYNYNAISNSHDNISFRPLCWIK